VQDKFGRSANAVFALAASSCSDLGCESIGSDLILLGLLKLEGRCATILGELGLDCERTCSFIRATALTNLESASFSLDDRRLSADGKKVLLAARCETLLFSRDVMLEEHLLLGILREPDTVAGALIKQLNLDLDAVRRQVQRSSIENSESGQAQPTSMATTSAQHPNSPLASAVTASAVMAEKQRQVKTIHAPQAVRLETDAFSSDTVQLLASTQHLALSLGAPAVSLEHLFYAALTQNTFVKYELIACGAKVSDLTGMGVDNSSPKLKALEAAEVLRQTIGHSMEVATQWQSAQVEPEHLFLSMSELKITPNHLIHFPQLDISAFLRIILTTVQEKRDKLSAVSGKRLAYAAVETVQSADFRLNSASLEALRHAVIAAKVLGQREIGPEVLLIGLASLDGQLPEQILAPWGIDSHLLKKMCQDLLQWSPQGGESEERLEPKQNEMVSLVLNRSYIMAQKSGEQAAPEHILPMLLTLAQGHIDPLLAGFAVTSETILLKLKAANNIESQAALIGPGPKPALDRSFEPRPFYLKDWQVAASISCAEGASRRHGQNAT